MWRIISNRMDKLPKEHRAQELKVEVFHDNSDKYTFNCLFIYLHIILLMLYFTELILELLLFFMHALSIIFLSTKFIFLMIDLQLSL